MPTLRDATTTEIQEMTTDEVLAQLDREARRTLGMSGEDFAEKWRNGEFRDNADPRVTQVAMLLPDAW